MLVIAYDDTTLFSELVHFLFPMYMYYNLISKVIKVTPFKKLLKLKSVSRKC